MSQSQQAPVLPIYFNGTQVSAEDQMIDLQGVFLLVRSGAQRSLGKGGTLYMLPQTQDGVLNIGRGSRRSNSSAKNPRISIVGDEYISSDHAVISWRKDCGYSVLDKSRNGTFVNGHKIPKNTPVDFEINDIIVMGSRCFTLLINPVIGGINNTGEPVQYFAPPNFYKPEVIVVGIIVIKPPERQNVIVDSVVII